MEQIHISTAPAVAPAIIDLKALGYECQKRKSGFWIGILTFFFCGFAVAIVNLAQLGLFQTREYLNLPLQ
jgi:hypothetical protein